MALTILVAVEQAGLRAILCDLAPGQLDLDVAQLERLLDSDTLAVVYVHQSTAQQVLFFPGSEFVAQRNTGS